MPEVTEEGCPFVCFPQLPGSGGRGLCLLHARHRLLAVPVSPGRAGLQTDTLVCESFFLLSFMCWLCAGLFKKCFLISVLRMRLFLLCWSFSSSFFSLVFFFFDQCLDNESFCCPLWWLCGGPSFLFCCCCCFCLVMIFFSKLFLSMLWFVYFALFSWFIFCNYNWCFCYLFFSSCLCRL